MYTMPSKCSPYCPRILKISTLPDKPWAKASADFCGPFPLGEMLLVLIDDYSRYPEVEVVESTSASRCSQRMVSPSPSGWTTAHHSTEKLSEDSPMRKDSHIAKITPEWPEANREGKRFTRNIGKVTKVASVLGSDCQRELYKFLASYRATPHPCTGHTPYDLCMNREIRTKIPSPPGTQPKTVIRDTVESRDS